MYNIYLKLLLNYSLYKEYINYIQIPKDHIEVTKILTSIIYLQETYNKDITIDDVELHFFANNEIKDKEIPTYKELFNAIRNTFYTEEIIRDSLFAIKTRVTAGKLALSAFNLAEGQGRLEDLSTLYQELISPQAEEVVDPFVTSDLETIYEQTVKTPGLRWRLSTLNRMLGSLRKGDFGFIFARPESFSRDTEVLTPNGWLAVDKVTTDTYISQVNKDLTTTFVQPKAVHPHEQTHCYHIHDELGRVDLIVTEGHGMIYEKDGKLWKERADTVKYYQGKKHHVSAATSLIENVAFLPEHQLAIAYQADGHTRNYKEYGYTFSFKKERKQQRLENILDACGFEYSKYKDGNRGHSGYYVKSKIRLHKNFDWINLSLVSQVWCQQFIEELSYWDATRRTETRFKFDTTNKNVADKVQAIAILAGYNCLLSVCIDDRSPKYSDIYSLTIRTKYQPVDGQCIIKERIPFKDTTYCFEVPSGMLLVRRNGAVAVSGNTGKTTFLASEITYFATQAKSPILWFNNEEQGNKVMLRCYQASLKKTLVELLSNRTKAAELYKANTDDSIRIYDSASITRHTVEKLCAKYQPALIIFDQIDKIKGFANDREDLRLGEIYTWARELAKTYAPVIGVCQASGLAEGKKLLNMDDVANAKTAKQAEADWILGIGKSHNQEEETVRYFNICKNKLTGDEDTIPELRHGSSPVRIAAEYARYEDIM